MTRFNHCHEWYRNVVPLTASPSLALYNTPSHPPYLSNTPSPPLSVSHLDKHMSKSGAHWFMEGMDWQRAAKVPRGEGQAACGKEDNGRRGRVRGER